MSEPALVVEDYSFWFKPQGGAPEGPPALSDVSIQIDQGAFVLVLGQSGAGKSTLALNLVGIYPDYFGGRNQGRILVHHPERGLINRREIDRGERFKLVNMLFQNPEDQIVTLTVEEEVGFALENYLFEPPEIHRRIDRALDLVGLEGFRERSTMELSGGEKQRVALAAMLALEPRVLVLDEPTSNLDPAGTADVLATIDRVRSMVDLAVLVIEHEVDEVFDRVDTVLLVEDQRVQGPFLPREFISERGLHVRDEMGLWIPQASEVALDLRQHGVPVDPVSLNGDELVLSVSQLDGHFPVTPSGAAVRPDTAVPGMSVIEIDGVSFSYGDHEVLKGVDLRSHRGELLAVVGQNGSGKSTLASLLNGINQPTSGEIRVEGKKTDEYEFAELVKKVAYIFQVPEKQFIRNSVFDEIAHGMRALGLDEGEVETRTLAFLESVRLVDRKEASPYVLSHGQKRRLSVAAMVVGEPDVVVLDEPTFGQDFQQAQNLVRLLRRLADGGASVIFITHDMRLVAEYADRAAVLCDGEIIFDGHPAELFASTDVLTRSRLKPPAVYDFSRQLLGQPLLTTPLLSERIKEVIGGQHRPVL